MYKDYFPDSLLRNRSLHEAMMIVVPTFDFEVSPSLLVMSSRSQDFGALALPRAADLEYPQTPETKKQHDEYLSIEPS